MNSKKSHKNPVIEVFNNCAYESRNLSGADHRAMEYCSIFKKRGYIIHLYIHMALRDRYSDKGYRITVTSNIDGKRWGAFITYLWNGIRACFLQERGLVSIIYSSHGLADVLPAVLRKLRAPSARWMSGFHLIAPNPFKGYKGAITGKCRFPTLPGIYQFAYQHLAMIVMKSLASLVMVSNNIDRNFLLRWGFNPSQVMVVYGGINWVDVNQAYSMGKKYDACFIGRLHPQKGIDDLLEIWSIVCRKKKDAKLAMIGNLDKIVREVDRRDMSRNVQFFGFRYGVEKFQILKSSRIFLFPSSYESFGIVAAEAMACGLPVVAYALPVFKEIYPKGMVKISIGDREAFANEVIELLFDEKRWRLVSREAKNVSEKFNWMSVVEKILFRLGVEGYLL